jgi:ubiquinol oxidase
MSLAQPPTRNDAVHAAHFHLNKLMVSTVKTLLDARFEASSHYARFYVLETVARVPYFAFLSVLHLRETLGERGLEARMRAHWAEADNESHHLLIMEHLGGNSKPLDRMLAQSLATVFYWYVVALYAHSEQAAYHLLELIERHAFDTYDAFIAVNAESLRQVDVPPIARTYYEGAQPPPLDVYGDGDAARRYACAEEPASSPRMESLYDVFVRIRDDETEHWQTLCSLVQCNSMLQNECAAARRSASREASDANEPDDADDWCAVELEGFSSSRARLDS